MLKKKGKIIEIYPETVYKGTVTCPYCGDTQNLELEQDSPDGEQQCLECDKWFKINGGEKL